MRIGDLAEEFVILERDAGFILTAEDIIGTAERACPDQQWLYDPEFNSFSPPGMDYCNLFYP
jgi:hypothetical protein